MKTKFLVLFVTIIFIFLSAEIAIRIIDRFVILYDIEMAKYATSLKADNKNSDLSHHHRKNSQAHLMGVDMVINSQGLRDKEYLVNKPPNTYRIMVLGDSITLGWGVEQKDCYAKQLEELLSKNFSPKTSFKYEVINTGVGNYNTVQELTYFKEDGYRFNPDMVILAFFINDAEPVPKKSKNFFLNHSHFAVYFWSKINIIRSLFYPQKNYYIDYYRDLYNDSNLGWIRCKDALIELNNYCVKDKKKFLIVFIPELHDLAEPYKFKDIYNKVADFLKSQEIGYLDLYPSFKNKDGRRLWVSYEDAHPNKTGHKIIADSIYKYLNAKGDITK